LGESITHTFSVIGATGRAKLVRSVYWIPAFAGMTI